MRDLSPQSRRCGGKSPGWKSRRNRSRTADSPQSTSENTANLPQSLVKTRCFTVKTPVDTRSPPLETRPRQGSADPSGRHWEMERTWPAHYRHGVSDVAR